jgi:GT2 family glycosyltransferase
MNIKELTTFDFLNTSLKLDTSLDTLTIPRLNLHVSTDGPYAVISSDTYTFSLVRNRFRDNITNLIVICSKDNAHILDYTLKILEQYHIRDNYDILLVDDRSISNDILSLSDKYNTSYIHIENDANIFNYSNINNIAALYAQRYNKELILFYNNDLWPTSIDTIDSLVDKHKINKSGISGCKLLYPTQQAYEDLGKPQHVLSEYLDKIYNTIQHGGIYFMMRKSSYIDQNIPYHGPHLVFAPAHLWRFYDPDTPLACFDSRCYAVTGAIQIINTNTFISLNGFNTSLCAAYQDIDLCLKAVETNLSVYYLGSESMYHAESLTQAIEKNNYDRVINSDNILWDMLWGRKLPNLLGFQK